MSNNVRSDTYRTIPASAFYAATPAKKRRVNRSDSPSTPSYTPHKSPRHYTNRNGYNKTSPRFTYDRNSSSKHGHTNRMVDIRGAIKYDRVFSNTNVRKRLYDSRENAFSMPSIGNNSNKSSANTNANGDKSPRQRFRSPNKGKSRSPDKNNSTKVFYRNFFSAKKSPYKSRDTLSSNTNSSVSGRKSWPSLNVNRSPDRSVKSNLITIQDHTPKKENLESSEHLEIFNTPFSANKHRRPVTLEQVQSDEENKENTEVCDTKDIRKDLFRINVSKANSETSFSRTSEQVSASAVAPSDSLYQSVRCKRDPLEPLPLPNIGNSCYMNSVLQTLFNCPMLMKEIQASCKQVEDNLAEQSSDEENDLIPITHSLISLFKSYHGCRMMDQINEVDMQSPLTKFKQDIGRVDPSFRHNYQQDAVEFLDCVLNSIDDEFIKMQKDNKEKLSFSNPISKVLKYGTGTLLECVDCHSKEERPVVEQHSLILCLPDEKVLATRDDWSLQSFVHDYFKVQRNESNCNKCSGKEKLYQLVIKKMPRAVILQLVRHSRDDQKRNERVYIPECIELPGPEVDDNSSDNHDKVLPSAYKLCSVICHHGSSLRSGHYNSFNFDTASRQWYKCDDTSISKTNFQSVQEESQSSGYCFVYVSKKYYDQS